MVQAAFALAALVALGALHYFGVSDPALVSALAGLAGLLVPRPTELVQRVTPKGGAQ